MPQGTVYDEYRAEIVGPRMVASARVGTLVVIGLNSAFIALDWWTHPEAFQSMLAVRLPWDLFMLGVYWALPRANPLAVLLTGLYATGLGMLAVIALAGGMSSDYWPGMMVLFLGIPVMLPLSVKQAATCAAVLSAGFVGLPAVSGETPSIREYLVPVFFVSAAAIECIASTAALEKLRLAEFVQRREIEAARDHLEELDRAKSRFTANIHHELRTPLTLTLAPLEGFLAGEFGELSTAQREYLKTMHVNALRLLKLINNLLDLAKIESNQLRIERRPLQLGELVSDVLAGARPMAERKQIRLQQHGCADLPAINADRDALEKVVVNLIGNALKFTEASGEITVRCSAAPDGVEVTVTDSGIGLAADQLERIFDRFAQADSSATRRYEGTGIGLSLSRELVELHGGTIRAESEGLGLGTTVRIRLPTGQPDSPQDELLSDPETAARLRGAFDALGAEIEREAGDALRLSDLERNVDRWEKERGIVGGIMEGGGSNRPDVLICEDNPDMRRLLAHILSSEFRVRLAANGKEGLDAVATRQPDLVVTDIMMPKMSGTELCRAIKADPATAGVPVILVTSKAERAMKIEGLELGADDYVVKPFNSRELLARARSLVRLRQLQAELARRNAALEEMNEELEKALAGLKEAEAQLVMTERLAAVGQMAAGIAHEANNPVNFAANAARTLESYVADLRGVAEHIVALRLDQPSDARADIEKLKERMAAVDFESIPEAVTELAGIILEGLDRTGRLVGDLRSFAGSAQRQRALFDVVDTLNSTVRLVRHSLHLQGVSIELAVEAGIPMITGEAPAIGQVFLNLLKNAGEALEGRGGTVTVSVRSDGEGVSFEFSDDGPGMEHGTIERVFEPFFTTKGAGRGTGLGLSISKRVIEEHQGRIEVTSAPGAGTRFSVWLPRENRDEA